MKSQKKLLSIYGQDTSKANIALDTNLIHTLLIEANKYIGTKHKMSGLTKKGIDCSGLICVSFKELGLELPHSANGQAFYGESVLDIDSLQKGDLVFFTATYKSNHYITHVGIYLNEGMFIHTSSSKGVILTNLLVSSYWKPKFVFAKRLFG